MGLAMISRTLSAALAFVFGSVAQGKESADSDIDVMVIGKVARGAQARTLSVLPHAAFRPPRLGGLPAGSKLSSSSIPCPFSRPRISEGQCDKA
jgi:hypothetical protein